MSKDAPLAVEVPASDRDKPGWIKVGVIAAVGFVVGIAWPRVLGVRLGPAAPGESAAAAAASASGHAGRAPEAPPASVVAKSTASAVPAASSAASSAPPPAPTTAAVPPNITVQKGTVLSCKTSDGETKKGKECGPVPGLDQLVSPRIRKIATCSGVEGQAGKLSVVVNADFSSGRFSFDIGKTSNLPNIDAVSACLKTSFHGTSTTATQHEHARYTVAYTAIFAAPGAGQDGDDKVARRDGSSRQEDKAEPKSDKAKESKDEKDERAEKAEPAASGEAQVAWEVALVRDAPKTGGLVTRLPRGTKVKVGSPKDGWYQIKFGEGFANEGWVYRGAIGR